MLLLAAHKKKNSPSRISQNSNSSLPSGPCLMLTRASFCSCPDILRSFKFHVSRPARLPSRPVLVDKISRRLLIPFSFISFWSALRSHSFCLASPCKCSMNWIRAVQVMSCRVRPAPRRSMQYPASRAPMPLAPAMESSRACPGPWYNPPRACPTSKRAISTCCR